MLTVEEVMEVLDVSRRTVWLWVENGKLPPPVKVPRSPRGGVISVWPVAAVLPLVRPPKKKKPHAVRAAKERSARLVEGRRRTARAAPATPAS